MRSEGPLPQADGVVSEASPGHHPSYDVARNGRICLIRSLVVRRLLTGGTEKGLSFSYSREHWIAVLGATAAECAATGSHEIASMVRALLEAERAALDWHRWRIPGQRRTRPAPHWAQRRRDSRLRPRVRRFATRGTRHRTRALRICAQLGDPRLAVADSGGGGEQAHADWIAAQMDEIARHGAHEFRG